MGYDARSGYDDCDSWRNIIFDGWRAHDDLDIQLRGEDDVERLLRDTKQHWERAGYTVTERLVPDGTVLSIDLGYADVQLYAEPRHWRARIGGSTNCLPPH